MDRFDALQAFARVVETGSFTKAARALDVSNATVTQLVQQLEARLRVKLLHRTTRQVRVTEDGAAYYERVVRLLADLEAADTSLSDASAALRGRLRVDVPSPLARLVLVPALPDFHARYPEIQLHLGVSDRMVDVIGDHVDCVLRGGELADSTLIARRVGSLTMGVYAAPAYLQRAGTPEHPLDLADEPHRTVGYLRWRSGSVAPLTLHREGETVELHGRHLLAVDDGNAYLAAGLAGLGALWLPRYMAAAHVARGELLPVLADWQVDAMPLYMAFPPNRHVSAKLRTFIDWVAAVLAQQPAITTA
ncbi:LysR substrate-binding domain-containing protein [Roseateles sp. DC23W]|uniref:LysR substrate-binding domain-containing protein n=1 Tax=Pelomonas dachongensis TaxID=3299029 RepID=A0ABW7EQ97_9BURK